MEIAWESVDAGEELCGRGWFAGGFRVGSGYLIGGNVWELVVCDEVSCEKWYLCGEYGVGDGVIRRGIGDFAVAKRSGMSGTRVVGRVSMSFSAKIR